MFNTIRIKMYEEREWKSLEIRFIDFFTNIEFEDNFSSKLEIM